MSGNPEAKLYLPKCHQSKVNGWWLVLGTTGESVGTTGESVGTTGESGEVDASLLALKKLGSIPKRHSTTSTVLFTVPRGTAGTAVRLRLYLVADCLAGVDSTCDLDVLLK